MKLGRINLLSNVWIASYSKALNDLLHAWSNACSKCIAASAKWSWFGFKMKSDMTYSTSSIIYGLLTRIQ